MQSFDLFPRSRQQIVRDTRISITLRESGMRV
jgi:hypothetical protein